MGIPQAKDAAAEEEENAAGLGLGLAAEEVDAAGAEVLATEEATEEAGEDAASVLREAAADRESVASEEPAPPPEKRRRLLAGSGTSAERSFDVVVVGAGPAGLGVASLLHRCGVESYVVLERHSVGEPPSTHHTLSHSNNYYIYCTVV